MVREDIFGQIEKERAYQNEKWGDDFDKKNTPNDWVAYLSMYLGKAVTHPWNVDTFQKNILKVATLAVAVLEQSQYAPRHYD